MKYEMEAAIGLRDQDFMGLVVRIHACPVLYLEAHGT